MHYKQERKKKPINEPKKTQTKCEKSLKVFVTTEKMPKHSHLRVCFSVLSVLPTNQQVDFEEEESINYCEQKCVSYGFYKYHQIRFENWLAICSMRVVL